MHGIGVHHAGMLPKYRLLVEQLAQDGLLKIICGTDTLGVGINVPIRTVLFTGAVQVRRSPAAHPQGARVPPDRRARRARGVRHRRHGGRPGARHVVENVKALAKAGDDPKKQRKVAAEEAAGGLRHWGQDTFDRLVAAEPEPLQVADPGQPRDAAERDRPRRRRVRGDAAPAAGQPRGPARRQRRLIRRAIAIYRTLLTAGVVERLDEPDEYGRHAAADRRPAAGVRPQPAAVDVRAGRAGPARPRGPGVRARRGVGGRGDAGGPAR